MAAFARTTTDDRRWRRLSISLLVALAGMMFATVLDYGMSGDEGVQHRYGRKLVRWYQTLGADPTSHAVGDMALYGGFFELTAECVAALLPLDVYEGRHVANLLFALLAFAAAYAMGAHLGGGAGGFFTVLFLALTPAFYGHSFNNPKDIPFAGTFALAASLILSASSPRAPWRRRLAAGAAIGLVAAVRVAGLVLFGYAAALWAVVLWLAREEEGRAPGAMRRAVVALGRSWLLALAAGWVVMIAFWPWAMEDPLRNPFRAWRAFSSFWDDALLFYDGEFVLSGQVSRFYLPKWFALTLPELYGIAFVLGVVLLVYRLRRRPLEVALQIRLAQAAWVALLAAAPVSWIVLNRTPLYDGLRHFLFVVPFLAVLAGAAFAEYRRLRGGALDGRIAAGAMAITCAITLADMVALHPYETVYFNRVVAGGLARAATRYETDYWCLTYKEGSEWLQQRYARATCREKIRVAGHSTQLQTSWYFTRTEEGRRLFKPVGVGDEPHFVFATTRFGDHENTPGRLVHTVERQGARLLYVFEPREPACDVPAPETIAR